MKKYLLLLLIFLISPINVKADTLDFDKKGSLKIKLEEQTENASVSGAEVTIYKLADATEVNNNLSFKYVDELNQCKVDVNSIKEIDDELYSCIQNKDLVEHKGITNSLGIVEFNNLDLGLYLVRETNSPSNYSYFEDFLVMLPNFLDNNWIYDVYSTPKTDIISLIDITVKKEWNNDKNNKLPSSVTIELLKDNIVIDTITLNNDNNWTYTWNNIEKSDKYSVREINIPLGYTASYRNEGYNYIVTNTNSLIKTGSLDIYIELSLLFGITLLLIGIIYNKRINHE